MEEIRFDPPYQAQAEAADFTDITTVPYSKVTESDGTVRVIFNGALTEAQREAVVLRVTRTANETTIRARAEQVLTDLRTVRDTTGTLSGAALSNSVRLLARVCIALIRLALRRFEGTE